MSAGCLAAQDYIFYLVVLVVNILTRTTKKLSRLRALQYNTETQIHSQSATTPIDPITFEQNYKTLEKSHEQLTN